MRSYSDRPAPIAISAAVELDNGRLGKQTPWKYTKRLADYLGKQAELIEAGRRPLGDVTLARLVGEFLWPEKDESQRFASVGLDKDLGIHLKAIAKDLANPEKLDVEEKRQYTSFAVLAYRAFVQEERLRAA